MFDRLLIANRGEIARRIMATARRLEIACVGVFSDADANAAHAREADVAVRIGPAPAAESYLRIDAILEAAAATGADAIHPGYGFLSENAAFAQACADAGLTFVGPPPAAIKAMGLKDQAKRLMEAAGVPVTPGYHGADQDLGSLAKAAKEIGFPVLIKAVAGGGGKGMRRVNAAGDFAAALASAQREAAAAFGDDRVLIERLITNPRHLEVQIFADDHGGVIHLFERDCSLQRRHQKVIEEAPAPGMTEAVRAALTGAAIAAARAVDYRNAGTIEFIADGSRGLAADQIFFMEMNTRLQVEHPVTELVTGRDLVELQLRVAAGEALPAQDEITLTGWAVEARVYAEDPANGFLPAIGALNVFEFPDFDQDTPIGAPTPLLRLDSAVEEGDAVTPFYDPMIAKAIAHADTRAQAVAHLADGLAASRVAPLRANTGFLVAALRHPDFVEGRFDTGFIDANAAALSAPPPAERTAALAGALNALLAEAQSQSASDPWAIADGWRMNAAPRVFTHSSIGDADCLVAITSAPGGYRAQVGAGTRFALSECALEADYAGARGWFSLSVDGVGAEIGFVRDGAEITLFEAGHASLVSPPSARAHALVGGDAVVAPMPGKIVSRQAEAGAQVRRGEVLLVLEAMKMEHALTAPRDGEIEAVSAAPGDQVAQGAVLIRLKVQPE